MRVNDVRPICSALDCGCTRIPWPGRDELYCVYGHGLPTPKPERKKSRRASRSRFVLMEPR